MSTMMMPDGRTSCQYSDPSKAFYNYYFPTASARHLYTDYSTAAYQQPTPPR